VYNNLSSLYGNYNRISSNGVPSNVHESVLETEFGSPEYLSDVYVEDASFLRVDNITLGYTFGELPGLDQVRVFGRVSNAFVLTGYSGSDPEVYSAGQGIDNQVYPRSRTFTGGINVQL
jgi:iron complex outermembrane receptor protein